MVRRHRTRSRPQTRLPDYCGPRRGPALMLGKLLGTTLRKSQVSPTPQRQISSQRFRALHVPGAAAIAVVLVSAFVSWGPFRTRAEEMVAAKRIQSATAPAKVPADLVITNAVIATMDENHPRASMIAIRGETIVAVAFNISDAIKSEQAPEVEGFIGPNTRVIDLHKQFVMPGFNDAHLHLFSAAYAKLEIDFTGVKSVAELQQHIRDHLKDHKSGEWILGRGWDHTLWPEKKFPSRQDLDSVSTKHPMIFRPPA